MMVTVLIHGANGEAEFGEQKLSLKKSLEYLNLLKSVNSFMINGVSLQYESDYLLANEKIVDGLTLNIYSRVL